MIQDAAPPRLPTPDDVSALRELAVAGRSLDAFAHASRFSPFEQWTDPRSRRAAEWLCDDLGAPRRGRAIALGTLRRAPRSAIGRLSRLYLVLATRGPLDGWRALRALRGGSLGDDATDEDRAELPLAEAYVHTAFRDFDRARVSVDEARRLGAAPRRAWMALARVEMVGDRYAEALAAAERARAIAPDNADAVVLAAHLRVLQGDDAGALALLREVASRTQSAQLALQLVSMLGERRLDDERARWIERWAERVPLLESPERLAGLRSDSAYDRGDLQAALRLARESKSPFHVQVAEHLARTIDDPGAKRVVLDVPFVRQHHMTCVPATLTAIAGYWGARAEHLEVADAICYDGTPHHSQRAWAEEHGFVARELTVTWGAARALLDRGVPLTVATVQAASAHLQAIVGYDERRGTLLLRDPFVPQVIEALAEEWIATWRASGPHGMVLVPEAQRSRLDGVVLPDADALDGLHATNAALERFDREGARAASEKLSTAMGDHRIARAAERALAAYDQDPERVLACAQAAAAAFPDFVPARLDALACMRVARRRDERIAAAEALIAARPDEPLYGEALARELADDAREHPRAARWLRRSMRARPDRHAPLSLLADQRWSQRAFDDALALYRLAACLGRFDEGAARAYFAAARALGREEEALRLLGERAADLGTRDAGAVKTLFVAHEAMGRPDEGLRVVDAALGVRPDDGPLLLFAAEMHAAYGDLDLGRELLERARASCRRSDWLRTASQIAVRSGAFDERRRSLEELVALEPLDARAHTDYALALAAAQGAGAARAHLQGAWSRAPHVRSIAHAYLEGLRGAGAAVVERAAREVVAIDPADAWAHRELALALIEQGSMDDARRVLDVAARLAPDDASLECVRAALLQREGRRDEARAALVAALDRVPDRGHVVAEFVGTAADAAERDAALGAIERIVHPRSVTGAGILAWHAAASPVAAAATVRASVERLRAARPELWVTWRCAVRERALAGDHAGAISIAREACARFPLVGAVWTDLAEALGSAGEGTGAVEAFERAVRVDAFEEVALSRLAAAYVRGGAVARARELLARAIGRQPTSVGLRLQLGEIAWGAGSRDEALAQVEAVLALNAEVDDAWRLLDAWGLASDALGRIEKLCAERPWSANAMLHLARARGRRDDLDGALLSVDRALAVDPRLQDAHDFRAALLVFAERYDDAEAACAPAVYGGAVPRELRGRAAWVRARRGDLRGASDAMRAVLREHPDYAWGWGQLADWSRQRGAPADYLAAAKCGVTAAPSSAEAHRRLAGAYFENGDRVAGRRALARAVDLEPGDERIARAAFDRALDDGDLAAAESLVPVLRAARSAAGACAEACVRARRGDVDAALELLRDAAVDPRADAPTLEGARVECVLAGAGDRVDVVFRDLLESTAVHPYVGGTWARARVVRGDLDGIAKAMHFLDPKVPAVRAAALEWLVALEETGTVEARCAAARQVRDRLAPCDDRLWTEVARALLVGAPVDECVRWTSDWRSREGATSWMLLFVASALREAGREGEALEVVRRAAPLEPVDGASRSHRAWLAFELAMCGQHAEARRWLSIAGDVASVPLLRTLCTITEASLTVQESNGAVAVFWRARATLAAARAECTYAVLLRAYFRAQARVAKDAGTLGFVWKNRVSFGVVAAAFATASLVAMCTVSSPGLPSGGGTESSSTSFSPSLAPVLIFATVAALRVLAARGRSR